MHPSSFTRPPQDATSRRFGCAWPTRRSGVLTDFVAYTPKRPSSLNRATVRGPDQQLFTLCASATAIATQWNARAAVSILLRAGAGRTQFINGYVLGEVPPSLTAALHVRKVIDAGGFKKYAQAHLATRTKTFESKFTVLPKELVRHVVSFWLHAGYY